MIPVVARYSILIPVTKLYLFTMSPAMGDERAENIDGAMLISEHPIPPVFFG